ncbi:MAG: hypothetical protein JO360_13370 [Acidobacteria bacterium]|nr:hypothetical protein [Acidobacteriota bacterium]
MMTEELIREENAPLHLELDYADEDAQLSLVEQEEVHTSESEARSKKDQIVALYESGTTDIAQIVRRVAARPSYVAQVLQREGLITGYFDLYTTTAREQNVYSRFFRNVLAFKTVEAARESVKKIDRLYNYFERLGDRAGQHQAMVLALTGKNRARWSGKQEESEVFSAWLAAH